MNTRNTQLRLLIAQLCCHATASIVAKHVLNILCVMSGTSLKIFTFVSQERRAPSNHLVKLDA